MCLNVEICCILHIEINFWTIHSVLCDILVVEKKQEEAKNRSPKYMFLAEIFNKT